MLSSADIGHPNYLLLIPGNSRNSFSGVTTKLRKFFQYYFFPQCWYFPTLLSGSPYDGTSVLYLRFGAQAADLDRLYAGGSGDRNGVGRLCGAGEACGRGRDGRGDDDARQRGGACLAAGLAVDDADLVDGGGGGQRGGQLGGQHHGPLQQLRGGHHGWGRGRRDGHVAGRCGFGSDLLAEQPIRRVQTFFFYLRLLGNAVGLWLLCWYSTMENPRVQKVKDKNINHKIENAVLAATCSDGGSTNIEITACFWVQSTARCCRTAFMLYFWVYSTVENHSSSILLFLKLHWMILNLIQKFVSWVINWVFVILFRCFVIFFKLLFKLFCVCLFII